MLNSFVYLPKILVYCTIHSSSNGDGEEGWSGLSDILQIDQFDPNWEEEVQSTQKNDQIGPSEQHQIIERNGTKKKMPRIRNTPEHKRRQKIYAKRYKAKVRSNPEVYEILKAKKNEYNMRWKKNKLAKMTETEREEFQLRTAKIKQQNKEKNKEINRKRFGGFSSARSQKLSTIRKLKAEGKASEEELRYLQKDTESEKIARRKQRAAKKEAMKRNT